MTCFKWIILVTIFIFGAIYLTTSINDVLFGESISTSLVDHSFKELGISLVLPEDWVAFDVSDTSNFVEDMEKYLIIEGRQGVGGYPRVEVYKFEDANSNGEDFDKQIIIDRDIERIKALDEIQTIEINHDENKIETLAYDYLTNIVVFQEKKIFIHCKDWIGEEQKQIILISICATNQQWNLLDEIYGQIIQSFSIIN